MKLSLLNEFAIPTRPDGAYKISSLNCPMPRISVRHIQTIQNLLVLLLSSILRILGPPRPRLDKVFSDSIFHSLLSSNVAIAKRDTMPRPEGFGMGAKEESRILEGGLCDC